MLPTLLLGAALSLVRRNLSRGAACAAPLLSPPAPSPSNSRRWLLDEGLAGTGLALCSIRSRRCKVDGLDLRRPSPAHRMKTKQLANGFELLRQTRFGAWQQTGCAL